MASLQTLTLKDLTLVAEEQAAARLEAACRSRVVNFSHETCGDFFLPVFTKENLVIFMGFIFFRI